MFNPNDMFALTGQLRFVKKNRFPPPFGSISQITNRLVQNLLCKRARWQQINLATQQVVYHVILDCCELVHLGYPPQLILNAFRKSMAHDSYYVVASRTARLILHRLPRGYMTWQMPNDVLTILGEQYFVETACYPFPLADGHTV